MAKIVKLEHPDNVTLIGGASQFWTDRPKLLLDADWSELLLPQVAGRTLVVGWTPTVTLEALAGAADELHVLVRGIVDASAIGEALPSAKVWCGDPRSLLDHAEVFDTVLCLADASRVLPLESESRSWREVADDVLALGRPDAAVVMWVENDLGIHRLISPHNPRTERSDNAWNVMATFDESRPVSLEQCRDAFAGSAVHVTWPSAQPTVLADPGSVDEATHAAFAQRACVAPLLGPDPVYILATAARAGRLADHASGWLVTRGLRAPLEAPLYLAEKGGVVALDTRLPDDARSAFVVFAELSAAQDMAGVRKFIADWSATFAGPSAPGTASLGLNVARRNDGGDWEFSPLAAARTGGDDRWEALGELVGLIRGRNWRHLWPAGYSDARILNHLGIMAGLHTVSPARAAQLITPAPDAADPFSKLDVQSLVAAIDRNNETIRSLRSQLSLAQLDLERLRNSSGTFRTPRRVLRIAKRAVKKAVGSGN
ncbi:hypothetical protein [Tessaracoccus oleiagri]|uniref:Uncharacterized protein n=1 Tax=Tessaracoccus oleiagri TaxID=686624 RepID=A0A1G9HE38_9ACTN|nr:hypothetical protein [Tessaracoccus oleiagri]SDL11159.1 hypothetical protein SAMN04488242_0248 [Tessaracoccus oleiagri]